MKKLNRKGFTLVELLAVIVILAIVVGITLVTVLPTLKKSRQEAFELTAQTAADYLEKQYQLSLIGDVSGDTLELATIPTKSTDTAAKMTAETVKKAGLKPENYISGTWYINTSTGRACVTLTASTNSNTSDEKKNLAGTTTVGEYYDVDPSTITSTGC